VKFLAVGDIMLSRGVTMAINRANDPLLPFKRLSDLFLSTDFNFGNLESPFSGNDGYIGRGLVFNAQTRNIAGLKAYNLKVLNLANNHALDQRLAGLQYTRKYLEDNAITYLGVGDRKEEAWQPKIIEIRGVKIGFIGASYASFNDGGAGRNDYVARIEEIDHLRNAIARLKSKVNFVLVTMHAGTEYTRRPNKSQVDFARAAVELGADLVIGAHPHWIQSVEYYRGKCIFYSLGNFIFDQEWSQDTKEGLAIKVTLDGKKRKNDPSLWGLDLDSMPGFRPAAVVKHIELIPVIIENYSTPRRATVAESERILGKIDIASQCIDPQLK
jgi:poly-gamma-glutamate synthesis protein (capsule biosynthesis protein)